MINIKTSLLFLFTALLYMGCRDNRSIKKYNKLVESELASGKHADSIFFGIYLGMTAKEFYTHCWKLNKKGLVTDGNNNSAVLYKLNHNELKYPASMNFYPEFNKNKISRMLVTFEYNAWAPWNKALFSDSLLPDVVNLYRSWYNKGNGFIKMEEKGKFRKIYIKVDGNRRIIIGCYNDRLVKVDYTDLLAEQTVKK